MHQAMARGTIKVSSGKLPMPLRVSTMAAASLLLWTAILAPFLA